MMQPPSEIVQRWKREYGVRTRPGLSEHDIRVAEVKLGPVPPDLVALYRVTNGMTLESFKLFPLFDASDLKGTWDSVQRANDVQLTRFLGRDVDLLRRFVVFAEIGGGDCAVIDRGDQRIWYEEHGDLHQTTFSLFEFIETVLKEQLE